MGLKKGGEKKNTKSLKDCLQENNEEKSETRIYVIQKHYATHLHYDLRLEMEGVLKSWAVPKNPPEERGLKRLAVQVEDHSIEYADFEGIIPEGLYGAGKVEIWDKGVYGLLERTDDKIVFRINGKRLKGVYYLIRLKGRGENNWLFFKK